MAKKTRVVAPLKVRSIEEAEKNPKQIQQWIESVNDIVKHRQPTTVTPSKSMPEIEALMQEWSPEMEDILGQLALPGPDLDLSIGDYSKLVCNFLDIPVHKLSNKKSVIEALYVLFSLYAEFKENPHFRNQTGTAPIPQEQLSIS
eukprot:TRINITY_DN3777_c0_g1_i8.p4 TRINITY_DN3777_c0_g1~~TRINITY_DN3777_c0_g1_i8.p4  ORF type:complete len:145 (-),score=10.63 TRINITY_DN3777_c0_g1_i8:66-500(-)